MAIWHKTLRGQFGQKYDHKKVSNIYSVLLPRLGPNSVEKFILEQLDKAGLGHNASTADVLALIIRSGKGLIRRTRNLCLGTLIEAVRDQIRIVDLKQVNVVLKQPIA